MTKPRYSAALQSFKTWQSACKRLPTIKLLEIYNDYYFKTIDAAIDNSLDNTEFTLNITSSSNTRRNTVELGYHEVIKLHRFIGRHFFDDNSVVIEPVVKYITAPCQCWWCKLIQKFKGA